MAAVAAPSAASPQHRTPSSPRSPPRSVVGPWEHPDLPRLTAAAAKSAAAGRLNVARMAWNGAALAALLAFQQAGLHRYVEL